MHKLLFRHGLSRYEIDATNVLPLLRTNNQDGLIYKMSQRYVAPFPISSRCCACCNNEPTYVEINFSGMGQMTLNCQRLTSANTSQTLMTSAGVWIPYIPPFVPILAAFKLNAHNMVCSCLGSRRAGLAILIDSVFPALRHGVPRATPRVTSDDYPEGNSCGSMCFREIDDSFMVTLPDYILPQRSLGRQEASVEWLEPDIDELECILEIIPDTLPCGLAKLVRKPCREVLRVTPSVFPMLTECQKGVHAATATHTRR